MKYLILILLLSSCYTKNQAIKKFCSKDTAQVTITIQDTIIVDSIRIDTIFNDTVDSVFFTKNKIEIKYIKIGNKIEIAGKYLGDTIYYEKKVLIEVPIDCPKQSWFDQMILEAKWWLLVIIAILILVIFKRNG